ncbi:MAG: secretin and TonB N-terminal domain-containing protein [Candidatus Zixiibacteriota bacterium]
MKKIFSILRILILLLALFTTAPAIDLNQKVSLQLEDIPIATVLQSIAMQYNLNIVQTSEIDGKLSLKLDEVTLENALKAILTANGLNYYITGDVIVIKPTEIDAIEETAVRAFTLHHISPSAALSACQDLLSSKGKIKIITAEGQSSSNGQIAPIASQMAVIDLPENIFRIEQFIKEIDRAQPQIAIEVRMIETNYDNEESFGLNWPTSMTARIHGVQTSSETETSGTTTEALGELNLPKGSFQWGKLSVNELSMVLDFLETEGNSKLISDPRVTTLNNHMAEIKVTTIIPIKTISRLSDVGVSQDIVSYQDEEIGITLIVTPHITDDGKILLDVNPTVAEITGWTADNQKPITSERSVKTKILVGDGESAVIGGLLKESNIENESRVFFLGSLPIIGNIFKHKSIQKSTTDLTILITPRIIND